MDINWNTIGLAVGLALYGGAALWWLKKPIKAAMGQISALPRMIQALLAVLAIVATVEAQKQGAGNGGGDGGTNEVLRVGGGALEHETTALRAELDASHTEQIGTMYEARVRRDGLGARLLSVGVEPTVTAEEIARGYRLLYETNDTERIYSIPSNAVTLGNLYVHGASSDWGRRLVDFGDWSFPYGSNHTAYSKFWWFLDGKIRVSPFSHTNEIATGARGVCAMQGRSSVWWAAGENNERIFGWSDVFQGGDTNLAENLQIVLKANGNFETWSNEWGRVYARINPNDWDGDGLDNTIDPWPPVSDGDCFVGWLNANCAGVLSATIDANDAIQITWNTNACESAYYWLYFTATHDGTRVTITCDGPSNLGNLVVIANEGMDCAVPLLIGTSYQVTANWPIANIYASDPAAEFWLEMARPTRLLLRSGSTYGPSDNFSVERPIGINMNGDGEGGGMTTTPFVGAEIGAITGNCCSINLDGSNYVWNCANCNCSGYGQWWYVTALWEGYTRIFDWQAQCQCQHENEENPARWVSLSSTSVVFLDGDMGHVLASFYPPESASGATATLRGGDGKIAMWMTTNRTGAVSLPMNVPVGGGASFCIEGVSRSGTVGDVKFYLDVDSGEDSFTITQSVTVVEVVRMDVSSSVGGTSANPPPFLTGVGYPFSVTNSLSPDKHFAVPFENVATLGADGFSIAPFNVAMTLVFEPQGVSASGVSSEWEVIEAIPQMSGSLVNIGGGVVPEPNARRRVPLPGARGRLAVDAGEHRPAAFGSGRGRRVRRRRCSSRRDDCAYHLDYTPTERQTVSFGRDWFHDGGVGDYLGRVNSASAPTVWLYNQVNDDTGMGAVATFCGVPTRMAKLSNFLVAYETQKLGVSGFRQRLARSIYGTFDDGTASQSWNAGIAVANGTSLSKATQAMSTNMWHQADAKERRLWPNDSATDNHTIYSFDLDFNYNFISPGFTTKRVEDDE